MDSKINGGGAAFPGEKDTRFGQPNDCNEGMSLRDYFAAEALHGLISHSCGLFEGNYKTDDGEQLLSDKQFAEKAYDFADAMLVARNRQKP